MDLVPMARAVNVLMSPLEWGHRDAWLRESLCRVREACGSAARDPSGDVAGELEALLQLPDDRPGWLSAALDDPETGVRGKLLPTAVEIPETLLPILSLRCAFLAGLGSIVADSLNPGLPTTRELRVSFGLRGREPQVALLAAEGLSNAAIAERLRLELAHGPPLPGAGSRPARPPLAQGAGPASHDGQRRPPAGEPEVTLRAAGRRTTKRLQWRPARSRRAQRSPGVAGVTRPSPSTESTLSTPAGPRETPPST